MGEKIAKFSIFYLLLLLYSVNAIEDLNIYSVNALYVIYQNNSVHEVVNYSFSSAINTSILVPVNKNISNLFISDGKNELNYSIMENEMNSIINISNNGSITKLFIRSVSLNDIFQKDSTSLFITDFNFNKPVSKLDVKIILPEGFAIYKDEYSPKDATILTDGKNIGLSWSKANILKSISFSVRFNKPTTEIIENNSSDNRDDKDSFFEISEKRLDYLMKIVVPLLFGIPFIIIISIIIGSVIIIKRLRIKAKEHLLKGFMEDEQKTILYLQKNKEAWQNKLRHEFKFSRAKTTRIIKKLEDKGLVKKEVYGKTNKIFWLK